MKKKITFLIVASLLLFSFKKMNDVLSDVGTTIDEVKQVTVQQVFGKDFSPYYTRQIRNACKKLPAGVREATLMSLGRIIRDYVESPDFQKDYYAYVDNHSNVYGFDAHDPRWEQERKQKTEDLNKDLTIDPDAAKNWMMGVDARLQSAQMGLDLLKDNPQLSMPGLEKGELEKQVKRYTELKEFFAKDKQAFEKKYIETTVEQEVSDDIKSAQLNNEQALKNREEWRNYKPIIKKQLQQFLEASAHIDFNAQLKKNGEYMVFVNPEYERKPDDWKFYYRCGREAVEGARKFAQQWLSEL